MRFQIHISWSSCQVFTKVRESIGLLRKLKIYLPRAVLAKIFKTFVLSHLDNSDVLYGQALNSAFLDNLESIQYTACLSINGAIRGISRDKLYQEVDLEFPT